MRKISFRDGIQCDKIQQAEQTESVQNLEGELYAVLFNANTGADSYDLAHAYYDLTDAGVPKANIISLEAEGRGRNRFIDDSATRQNLELAFDIVRKSAGPNDRLFSYVTNHGTLHNGKCYFNTYDGKISERDFEKMTADLPINFGLFYFAQCFSGGFAERMGYGRNIGMSNVSREENAYGRELWPGAYFTQFLFPGITEKGKTIETAFNEAVFEDTSDERVNGIGKKDGLLYPVGGIALETPQLRWQNADPSKLCLFPYNLEFMNEKK